MTTNHQVRLAARPVGIGEVMRAGGVGKVIASNNPGFTVGDQVAGGFTEPNVPKRNQSRRRSERHAGHWLRGFGHLFPLPISPCGMMVMASSSRAQEQFQCPLVPRLRPCDKARR